MKSIDFPLRNMKLAPPKGMGEDECNSLPVWSNGALFVSAWEVTDEDLERIKKSRTIYLAVYGAAHPPVMVQSEAFIEPSYNFNVGDEIYCDVYIPGESETVKATGTIELRDGTYFVNTGKSFFPMAYVRNPTIIPKVEV